MSDLSGLEADLRSNAVSVESVETGDPTRVTYITAFPGETVDHGEIGRVLTTFIERQEADQWDPVRVEGTVLRFEDDVLGTWHAEAEWFEDLANYRISEEEFSARVLDTLTHATEEPEAPR